MEFARACGTLLFDGYKGLAWKDERILETGCTVWMYLTLLNCTLKNGIWLWIAIRYSFCYNDTISRTKRLMRGVAHNQAQIPGCQIPDNLSAVWAHRLSAGTPPRERRHLGRSRVLRGVRVVGIRGGSFKDDLVSSFRQLLLLQELPSMLDLKFFFFSSLVVMVSLSPKIIL